jgi:hypothetical protein
MHKAIWLDQWFPTCGSQNPLGFLKIFQGVGGKISVMAYFSSKFT